MRIRAGRGTNLLNGRNQHTNPAIQGPCIRYILTSNWCTVVVDRRSPMHRQKNRGSQCQARLVCRPEEFCFIPSNVADRWRCYREWAGSAPMYMLFHKCILLPSICPLQLHFLPDRDRDDRFVAGLAPRYVFQWNAQFRDLKSECLYFVILQTLDRIAAA